MADRIAWSRSIRCRPGRRLRFRSFLQLQLRRWPLLKPGCVGRVKGDLVILDAATKLNRAVITKNCVDFAYLHRSNPAHIGILLHFTDRNRELQLFVIARGIARIEREMGSDLSAQLVGLNDWQH
jgi:hypothetical protein